MKNIIEEIQQDIRELRDAGFHVCPFAEHQKEETDNDRRERMFYEIYPEYAEDECTCKYFDEVIDKLEVLKNNKKPEK